MSPASIVASRYQPRPSGILGVLVAAYVALLPYQFQVERSFNLAPADLLLVAALVLAAGQLKYRKHAWTIWHLGIAWTFLAGSLISVVRTGTLDRYELLNKSAGLFLPFLSYAAVTTAIVEWDEIRHILRVFTLSVAIQNAVAVAAFLATYFLGLPTFRNVAGPKRLWRPSGDGTHHHGGRIVGTCAPVW
jgi:hypothetical protein